MDNERRNNHSWYNNLRSYIHYLCYDIWGMEMNPLDYAIIQAVLDWIIIGFIIGLVIGYIVGRGKP